MFFVWGCDSCLLQRFHRSIYSTFIAYSNKPKLKLNILCFRNSVTVYFFPFPFAGAAACPALGRFAPYLERLCVRPATPAVSKVPRTM